MPGWSLSILVFPYRRLLPILAGEETEPAGPVLPVPHCPTPVLPLYPPGPLGQVAGEGDLMVQTFFFKMYLLYISTL